MKKIIAVLYEKMMHCIEQCHLNEEQIEKSSRYLALDIEHCNLGIVNYQNMNENSFSDLKNDVAECYIKLQELDETERFVRFFDLIFQVFGVSMIYGIHKWMHLEDGNEKSQLVALPVSYRWDYTREHVPKVYALGVLAGILINEHSISTDGYREVLKITEDRNIMAEALKYTHKFHPYADLVILSTMFYMGKVPEPKGRVQFLNPEKENVKIDLQGMVTEDADSIFFEVPRIPSVTTEFMKRYPKEFEYYTKLIADSIGSIFKDKLTEQEEQCLKNFIYQDKDGEAVLTNEVKTILSAYEFDGRNSKLLVGFAVLNYRQSPLLLSFLKLCIFGRHMKESMEAMYYSRYNVSAGSEVIRWYYDLQPDTINFIKWLMRRNLTRTVAYFAFHYPHDFIKILMESNIYGYLGYFKIVKDRVDEVVQEKYYKEILDNSKKIFYEKLMNEIRGELKNSNDLKLCELVERYLMGECSTEELFSYQKEFDENRENWVAIPHIRIMKQYKEWYGADDFYQRYNGYLVLLKLYCLDMISYSDEQKFKSQIEEKFSLLTKLGITIEKQFEMATALYQSKFSYSESKMCSVFAIIFNQYLKKYPEETMAVFSKADEQGQRIIISAYGLSAMEYKEQLLEYITYPDLMVQKDLRYIFIEHENLNKVVVPLLKSSKSAQRMFAALVIDGYCEKRRKSVKNNKYKKCLLDAFEREKNKTIKRWIAHIFYYRIEPIPNSKELRDFLNHLYKRVCPELEWLFETPLPTIHRKENLLLDNGTIINEEELEQVIEHILKTYHDMKPLGIDKYSHTRLNDLKTVEVESFANVIYDRWMKAGAKIKDKWALHFSIIYGGAEMAVCLEHQINQWVAQSRTVIAIDAIKALGMSLNPIALLVVDKFARESRYPSIKKAAKDALFFAAQSVGISVEEKDGAIVPNFKFDKMIMVKWQIENWKKIFLKNQVMLQYGYSLIWGYYESGVLKQTFRYTLEERFFTMDNEEYILPGHGEIGLIHPAELTDEEVLKWSQCLSVEKIEQSFRQLERRAFRMTEEEKTLKQSYRFQGISVNGRVLSHKLLESGWKRGEEIDFGIYEKLYCEDLNRNLACELYFSGAYTGNEEDEDVIIYYIRFYLPKGKGPVRNKWSRNEVINTEEMQAPYFSEIIYQLTQIIEEH